MSFGMISKAQRGVRAPIYTPIYTYNTHTPAYMHTHIHAKAQKGGCSGVGIGTSFYVKLFNVEFIYGLLRKKYLTLELEQLNRTK